MWLIKLGMVSLNGYILCMDSPALSAEPVEAEMKQTILEGVQVSGASKSDQGGVSVDNLIKGINMKIYKYFRLLLLFLSGLLSGHVYSTPLHENVPNSSTHHSQPLAKVNSLKDLPDEIVYLLSKKFGEVADIGKPFNSSCIITFKPGPDLKMSEPRAGLKEAALGKDAGVLKVAVGGFAMRYHELKFFKDDKGWYLQDNKDVKPVSGKTDSVANPVTEYVIKGTN